MVILHLSKSYSNTPRTSPNVGSYLLISKIFINYLDVFTQRKFAIDKHIFGADSAKSNKIKDLDGFQKSLSHYALDESSLSIGRVK